MLLLAMVAVSQTRSAHMYAAHFTAGRFAIAMSELGVMISEGDGVAKPDRAAAARWCVRLGCGRALCVCVCAHVRVFFVFVCPTYPHSTSDGPGTL